MGKQWKQCQPLFFLGSKITTDGDCIDMGHGKEKGEQVGGVQKGQREEKGRTRANPELDTQECWERGLLHWVE